MLPKAIYTVKNEFNMIIGSFYNRTTAYNYGYSTNKQFTIEKIYVSDKDVKYKTSELKEQNETLKAENEQLKKELLQRTNLFCNVDDWLGARRRVIYYLNDEGKFITLSTELHK